MGEVLSFPNGVDRSWNLMAPEYREILHGLHIRPSIIEPILSEMEIFYKRINGSVEPFGFALPAEAGAEVTRAVENFARQTNEAGRKLADTAHTIILQLLIEKHGGLQV